MFAFVVFFGIGKVYEKQEGEWDCVCTCFFIDTAKNVVQYLRTIAKILKPGGLWINLGPLLYHYADMYTETSVELTLEEILVVSRKLGFEISGVQHVRCAYARNPASMLKTEYNCAFFVGKKKWTSTEKD